MIKLAFVGDGDLEHVKTLLKIICLVVILCVRHWNFRTSEMRHNDTRAILLVYNFLSNNQTDLLSDVNLNIYGKMGS